MGLTVRRKRLSWDVMVEQVLVRLRALGSERDRQGMARYGINTTQAYGVSIYKLRPLAKEIGTDHRLALALWRTGVHEARMLAVFIDDPARVTGTQMERWAKGFDSWDLCDQVSTSLFDQTALAWTKAVEWSRRPEEFVRRAGFAMMAGLAVHDKAAADAAFLDLLPAIAAAAGDDRNFVKKAVNWALRNIGKRNLRLNRAALAACKTIAAQGTRSARWIAADARRELESPKVQARLRRGA
jgi:3-methyladenine DNA glycosylase AlkD